MQERMDSAGASPDSDAEDVVDERDGMLPVWRWVESVQTTFPEIGIAACITRSVHIDYRYLEK